MKMNKIQKKCRKLPTFNLTLAMPIKTNRSIKFTKCTRKKIETFLTSPSIQNPEETFIRTLRIQAQLLKWLRQPQIEALRNLHLRKWIPKWRAKGMKKVYNL